MSKRSKKNRRAKVVLPQQGAKRGNPRLTVMFLAATIILSLGIWWWKSKSADNPSASNSAVANAANPGAAASNPQFQKLMGRWQRHDGGYVLAINSIAADGRIEAAYYNPKSIHVAKAEASRDGGTVKVFIELRDVNYPGSTYTLTYDPASDQLNGIYYQAVEKQRFPVAFVRLK